MGEPVAGRLPTFELKSRVEIQTFFRRARARGCALAGRTQSMMPSIVCRVCSPQLGPGA